MSACKYKIIYILFAYKNKILINAIVYNKFMEDAIIEKILLKSESLKKWVEQFTKKRYLFDKALTTATDFYVGIKGLRGIGKTVFLLQLSKMFENSIYLSADAVYLRPHSIYEITQALGKRGFKDIFIDEIHLRSNWQDDIKTIYDEHELRIFFSGSSSIELKKSSADLSRRVILYDLKPLSFREFLNIRKNFDIPYYSFDDIIKKGKEISIKHLSAFEYFDEHMKFGGVLYSGEGFYEALENSLEKIISRDLASLRDINIKYEEDAYKILYHVAVSSPFEISFSSLSQKLGISKTFVIRLISDLASAGVIIAFYPCKQAKKDVKKEPKIYLTIPFRTLFTQTAGRGIIREEFFVNHTEVSCYLKTEKGEKTSDFSVNGLKIEVGGVSKDFRQNPDYIAVDSALFDNKKIPLFLVGFLY